MRADLREAISGKNLRRKSLIKKARPQRKPVGAKGRVPEQALLYQAIPTRKDRVLKHVYAVQHRAEERYAERMKELKEARDD
jgi:hypothetical protein